MPVNKYTGERIHPAHLVLNLPPVGPQQQERKTQHAFQPSLPVTPENANQCLQALCAILG
jgi:hypothetical protein